MHIILNYKWLNYNSCESWNPQDRGWRGSNKKNKEN